MNRFLLALALTAGAAFPAFSMTAETMSCHDFSMMDEAGQMAAMAPAEGAMAAPAEGAMAAPAEGAMATTGDDAGGMMASDDDGMMAAATDGCKAHPDMTVGDAMKAMK